MQKEKLGRIITLIALMAIFATSVSLEANLKKEIETVNGKLENTISIKQKTITDFNDFKKTINVKEKENSKVISDLKIQNKLYEEKIKVLQNKIEKIGIPKDF